MTNYLNLILFVLLYNSFFLFACGGSDKSTSEQELQSPSSTATVDTISDLEGNLQDSLPENATFSSPLRPGQSLKTEVTYIDTVTFINYNDNGDYFYIYVSKNRQNIALINDVEERNLNKGDVISISWEMDSMWVAGDGESLWIEEWIRKIRKVEDGKLSAFLKSNKKSIKYIVEGDFNFDNEYEQIFSYYLVNTSDSKVRQYLNDDKGIIEVQIQYISDVEIGNPSIFAYIYNLYEGTHSLICCLALGYSEQGWCLFLQDKESGEYKPIQED